MRRWFSRTLPALFVAVASLSLFSASSSGQYAPQSPARIATVLDEVLREGIQLEEERRWGEALSHYEDALRTYPGDRALEQRLNRSRLHYDLARRYNDGSFRNSLKTLSERDALAAYAEVLLKIESHFVDVPSWQKVVDRGTSSLGVALGEPIFRETHLPGAPDQTIDRFQQHLHARLAPHRIESRHAAQEFAATTARTAARQLGLSPTAVVLEYVCGATQALDDYSGYLTTEQLNEVYAQIDGNFVGLGLELKADDGALLIVKVITGSPAAASGIRAGDRIIAVDGRTTRELSTDAAADMLQGPEGSVVTLNILSPGQQPRVQRIERRQVEVPSVDDVKIIDRRHGIAYLKLCCFQKTTTRDLDAALWKLNRSGMAVLIVDVRNNPGGLLTSSVEVVDKFVDRGTIVSTRGRNPREDFTYSAHAAGTWRVPLVVLIDGDSASASEIFAGAIRDHRRGTIVGERSYGKGSVQGIFPLNVGRAGLRLTTAKFYSPSGHPFSKVGVAPHVTVQQVARPVDGSGTVMSTEEDDPALSAAVEVARQQVARR